MASKKDQQSEKERVSGDEILYDSGGAQATDEKSTARSENVAGYKSRVQGNKLTYNPLSIDEYPQLSPEEERAIGIDLDKGVAERLRQARAIGPSVRQQTQAEILNLVLLARELGGNPFSVRRLPFSIMRDMAADPDIAFALYYIETPLINASWSVASPDAQIAAAVDAAFRPINSSMISKFCNALRFGYQPLVKRWELGKLSGVYRDRTSEEPEKDIDIWPSKNVDALLPKTPLALPPENCLPRWNEMGNFDGFMYSPVPIPNPMMLGVAQTYGPQILSGYPIPLEYALWIVNERSLNFGCSPADEPVLTTDGYVPIGELNEMDHKLVSASFSTGNKQIFRGGRFTKGTSEAGYAFKKGVRHYSGELLTIKTNSSKTRVTPEHKFTVKWDKEAHKYWAVYLMRRDKWWRIGTTRLQKDKGAACSGVGNRLQTEQANDAWVLGVFKTFRDARYYEALWSQQYNIPDWTFKATGPKDKRNSHDKYMRNSDLHTESGVIAILLDRKLKKEFPLYSRAIGSRRKIQAGWRNQWTIQAVNLLPGLMNIPVDPIDKGSLPEWKTFTVEKERYNGLVFSLEVEPYHHYISGGAITQNSLYGSPRSKRAYRFWWSYWFRWALADRSFENKADPAKMIYYPTEVAEALDADNPFAETPLSLQQKAIQIGNSTRSGTTIAFPGDFMIGEDGKTLNQRKWDMKYLEGGENFSLLDQNFMQLRVAKMSACFLPEQAFIDATMAGQTSSQRYISAQMGEIYQESQQLLSNEYDEYVNKYWIPEFIAANFPDKIDIPCKRVTRAYGSQNSELVKQIITLVGQKNPENLNVDMRELMRQNGFPLQSEAEVKRQEEKRKEMAAESKPPVMAPAKKEGIQGYNAGVEKTETGEHVYFQPGDEIYLSSSDSFLQSLPKIPPYEDVAVRSAAMQMRKLMMDRYKNQITSLANQIRNKTILKLAEPEGEQPQQHKPGLGAGAAKIAAAGAVAAWLSDQAVGLPAVSARLKDILGRIVGAAGRRELKLANLDSNVYDPSVLEKWVDKYTDKNLSLMDHTTQDVFKDFLEKQLQENSHPDVVAQQLEDHFADLPITYSGRAVRAQVRDAYNKGMLQAGLDAGIDQVMAHDASDGTNPTTDKKCVLRNGRVFNLSDAMKETEHPNGSLHWSYLNTQNLSVEITDDIPDNLELSGNMMAAYDSEKEKLYIKTSGASSESKFLITLGERLKI